MATNLTHKQSRQLFYKMTTFLCSTTVRSVTLSLSGADAATSQTDSKCTAVPHAHQATLYYIRHYIIFIYHRVSLQMCLIQIWSTSLERSSIIMRETIPKLSGAAQVALNPYISRSLFTKNQHNLAKRQTLITTNNNFSKKNTTDAQNTELPIEQHKSAAAELIRR